MVGKIPTIQQVRRELEARRRRRQQQEQAREWLRTTERLVLDGLSRVTMAALEGEYEMLRAVDQLTVWLRAYGRAVRRCADLGLEVDLHPLAREAIEDLEPGQVRAGG